MPSYNNQVTPEWETEIKGRNPSLQGQHLEVYQFIKDNPGCVRSDVTRGCGLRGTSATARVKELIDTGFVHSSSERTKLNPRTRKRVQTLWPMDHAMHRKPKDKVLVTVTLQVDEGGNYHATAKVFAELPTVGRTVNVMTKEVTLLAPYPSEYKHSFIATENGDQAEVPVEDTLANVSLIIDAT